MDPRVPCRDCSIWPCICGNQNIWPTDVRRVKAAPRVPRIRQPAPETRGTLAVGLAIVALNLAAFAALVWMVMR